MPITIQSGAHQFTKTDITKYSLMMGGLNVTHDVLKQYDPLIGGYYRLFMVTKPMWVNEYYAKDPNFNRFTAFKHILEYGNLGVSGYQDSEMEFDEIKGGFVGKKFELPTVLKNDTNRLSIKVLEFSGSPIREVLHTWLNGTSDENGGFTHYNGMIPAGEIAYSQANQTAEFFLVNTDRTGMSVENAVMFANCFPTKVPNEHFNVDDPSDHSHVELTIEFTCTCYTGIDVTEKAKILLKNHQIMTNSLEFYTGLDLSQGAFANKTGYNPANGRIETRTDTEIGGNKYRTKITNTNPGNSPQALDVTSYTTPTPSFTDIGNRLANM